MGGHAYRRKIPEIEEPFIKRQKFIANKGNITKVKTPWYVKLAAKILPPSQSGSESATP